MQLSLKKLVRGLGDMVFPDPCLLCHGPKVNAEPYICTRCQLNLPREINHNMQAEALAHRFWGLIPVVYTFAFLQFTKGSMVQKLMHHMKYQHQPGLAYRLGVWFASEILPATDRTAFDSIIPVPLHPRKLRSRGYNQSYEIARGIADVGGWTLKQALERHYPVHTQTELNRWHRFENTRSQFALQGENDLQNQHILLVDDIVTTGATMVGCSEPLLKMGAKVSIGTIALSQ